jgi:hypothetical protein
MRSTISKTVKAMKAKTEITVAPVEQAAPVVADKEPGPNLMNLTVLRRVMLPGDGYNGEKILEAGTIIPASVLPADVIKRFVNNGAVKRTWLKPSSEEAMAGLRKAEMVRRRKERNTK